MSGLPPQERFHYLEPSRRSTVQTVDEQNGGYDSESDTSIRHKNSKNTPSRFLESYNNDYDRSSRSHGHRSSRRRDQGHGHTRSIHAPSSAAYPPASATVQYSPCDGQAITYMEPRGGQLRPYYNPTTPHNPVHASPVAANGGPSYHAYYASNPPFPNSAYSVNSYPAMSHHTYLHDENHPHPAGAYYAGDHQHHHLRTGKMQPSDNIGYMQQTSSHNPLSNPGYGSSIPDINEAEKTRRDLETFKRNHTTDHRQRARERERDKEREIEKKEEEKRNVKREEKARAKRDKEEADKMKERITQLRQQMAEVQATMYQEKQRREIRDREELLDNKRVAFENLFRDSSHTLSTPANMQFDQKDPRGLQGTEQMLQQIVGYLERLWGEPNIPQSDFERLLPREILARRPSMDTDRSGTGHQVLDMNLQRQVEEITMNFLHKFRGVPNPLLALRQGSSASDYNRSAPFDVSDHAANTSKVGSSSSRTAVNTNPGIGDPMSPKSSEFQSHLRPPETTWKKYHQTPKSRNSNPPQKPSSKPKENRGRRPPVSENLLKSDDDSSDGDLDEFDESTDENTDNDDDYDSSSSEMEEPRRHTRRKEEQGQKPKREGRFSRKPTKPKQQRGKHRHRGHAAYAEDETEEDQDKWRKEKLSRYAYVPPPAPNPPGNETYSKNPLQSEHYQRIH
ncbi:hypothetical protein UA08_05116 [Talaromyces atroroseus]|uniref:Uncharacterized protein n=1 Tax=Talaromyces atroroseus TaxID=1441469 RepID=A0A225AVT0_TALAT|nr:hypothetical protein UA08_05116 [Talaromyces atroroseus]OKL59709.1 hypothetical protein UA08_05116 [Talaromyces atroroseus]